jgi:hypothetical protein
MSDGLAEKYRRAKLDEDIAELEAKMYGTPDEDSPKKAEQEKTVLDDDDVISPDQSSDEDGEVTMDPFKDETAGEDTQPNESEVIADLRKQLADEKHRFNRYKGSTDRSLFNLRTENASLNKEVADLKERVSTLSSVTLEDDSVGEEARSILGDEAADIIDSLKAEVRHLKKQIDSESIQEHTKKSDEVHKINQDQFMDRLRELVPDLDAMNQDPGFNKWLRQPDDFGVERLSTLRGDQSRYDYARVAGFFNEYKASVAKGKKSKTRKVEDNIDAHTGPKGKQSNSSSQSSRPSENGWIKQSEINKYQSDIAHGKYRNHSTKAEAMELKIFKAIGEGKIIQDEKPVHQFRLS